MRMRTALGVGLAVVTLLQHGAAAATSTALVRVSPIDAASQLAPGYTVTRTVAAAACVSGADTVRQTYSCVASGGFYSPCWYEDKGSAPHALCLTGPFSTKVVRISHASGLKDPRADKGAPRVWGIRTTTKLQCQSAAGATISFQGRRISYFCGHHIALLGPLDRSGPQWTVHGAHYDFSHGIAFSRPTTYTILTAVIGDPSLSPAS